MNKIKVFIDTSALAKMLSDEDDPVLFSDEMLEKVEYIVNPIVFQELLFIVGETDKKEKLGSIGQHFNIIPVKSQGTSSAFRKKLGKFRNYGIHSNDVLILGTAKEAECDYLLTYDKKLIHAAQEESFSVTTPHHFLELIDKEAA